MNQTADNYQYDYVIADDGVKISYKIIGKGPGLLIVHGGFRASQHYQKLADLLSEKYTVYIMDRRGRNKSGPKGNLYNLQTECNDVLSIIRKHNIAYLFGHSYGGLISLNVGLQYPIKKIATYEPALVSYVPISWFPKFERELQKRDFISASITFLKGMQMGGVLGKIPSPILKVVFRFMAKGPDWEENKDLLLTFPEEMRAGLYWDQNLNRYQDLNIPTLVLTGTKSPNYLRTAANDLVDVLPEAEIISLERLDHNAPDEKAPEKISAILQNYFSGGVQG